MYLIESNKYRKDIDGLRAYAVIAVVIFHFGYLPNGFLGVDVFFVISGYLITGIIYTKVLLNQFSVKEFYLKRTKRILPLVSFICLNSLILGLFFMLPDDLENLAQSIIATNFFNNNTLQVLTTKNYWDVVNEYKPLMHTWSLAIEEQYYLFYPFLFTILERFKTKLILPILMALTLLSMVLFFAPFQDYYKFYLLPFRFFELSLGGICAILLNRKIINHNLSFIFISLLITILCFEIKFINNDILLLITILITCGVLITNNTGNKISHFLLENKSVIFLGKISFSIYMWHQLILAFARYFVFQDIAVFEYIIIFIITILLSIATYYIIEQPFRYKIKSKNVIISLVLIFFVTTGVSLYIYDNSGIIKDIPELGIKKELKQRGVHSKYNDAVYNLDAPFISKNKTKILVIGNSFARDWCNVLQESKFNSEVEISYIYDPKTHPELNERVNKADYIFVSTFSKKKLNILHIDSLKTWCVGTKNFGENNGIYYNYSGDEFCQQRTHINNYYIENNRILQKEWGNKYISLIEMVIDEKNTVPVFTPDCKFISQDCRHFTKYGAKYFAKLIEASPVFVLNGSTNK